MDFMDFLLNQSTRWLRGEGPENDIVISSRIRLARNLAGFPFISKATIADRQQIEEKLRNVYNSQFSSDTSWFADVEEMEPLDRHFLRERQLLSAELSDSEGPRAVIIDKEERFSVMVNEEDHLRIQAMTSGLQLDDLWNEINAMDDLLANELPFAFSDKYGYLTACPTNIGTGIRVSVMVHLPALVVTKEIEKVFRSLAKVGLAVRGMYGEGSQALGDLFQISNQTTLGQTETGLIGRVCEIIPQIISYERQAREFLLKEHLDSVMDRASRAVGVLQTARTIGSEEAMHHLSSIRLGIHTQLLESPLVGVVNELLLRIQPSHLQKHCGKVLSPPDRDVARAKFLRERLTGIS